MSEYNSTVRIFISSESEKNRKVKSDIVLNIPTECDFFPPTEYKDQLEEFFVKFFDFIGKTGKVPEIGVQGLEDDSMV